MVLREVVAFVVSNIAELMMFAVGMQCRLDDVLVEARNRSLVIRELILVTVAIPLLTLVVVHVIPISAKATTIAMLFAISPAAPLVLRTFRKHKAMTKALTVVTIGLSASIVVVPVWIAVLNQYFGYALRVHLPDVMWILIVKVFLPLALGLVVRSKWPKVADKVGRVVHFIVVASLVIGGIYMLRTGRDSLHYFTLRVAAVLAIVSLGSALMGELVGGRDPDLREIMGNTAINGNPAIALSIIGASYPDLEVGGFVAAYLIYRAIASGPYLAIAVLRRKLALRRLTRSAREPASSQTRSGRSGGASAPTP